MNKLIFAFAILTLSVWTAAAQTTNGTTRPTYGIFPADAVDVDVRNGALWVVGGEPGPDGYEIWQRSGNGWTKVSGGAFRIAIGGNGSPWIVNSKGAVFQRAGNEWRPIPAPQGYRVVDIAVDAVGDVWMITDGGTVYQWTGTGWKSDIALNAGFEINSVPNAGVVQAIDRTGKFWTRQGSNWVIAKDAIRGTEIGYERVALDFDGTKWGITDKGRLKKVGEQQAFEINPTKPSVTTPQTAVQPLKISIKQRGAYLGRVEVYAIDPSGQKSSLYSIGERGGGVDVDYTVTAAARTGKKIRIDLFFANLSSHYQPVYQALVPSDGANTVCYQMLGEIAKPWAESCDKNAPSYRTRHITFKNQAGFNAQMNLMYFVEQKINGVSVPIAKMTDGPIVGFLFDSEFFMPDDYMPSMPVTLIITAFATTKNDLFNTKFDMKGTDSPCYKVWGTIVSPQAGPC
ncbi:MAG: hypothetical protein IPI64_00450 [Chloracidobacterium sp.]|nr:hypothetical protein [Chloracidobacterium sp.]